MGRVGVDRLAAGLATTGGGGGGGTPSGSDTEIQYNDNGAFGSDAGFIRTPKGFFATQAEGGALSAETMLGSGDFTEGGQYPIFANGALFSDDDTNIFGLAGDLTTITGGKGAITMVSEGDDDGGIVIDKDGPILFYQGFTASSTVSADTTEALIKFEGPTLTTEVSVNDNGIEISYDGVTAYTLPLTDGTAGQVLSTDGAGVLDWVAAPIILEASVTIASADVLILNTTPIEIVAAPGAGFAIEVFNTVVSINFNTTPYATNIQLQLVNPSASNALFAQNALDASVATRRFLIQQSPIGATDTQILENASLQVSVKTGNPTAGDSDITVYVTYRIITL